MKLTRKEKKEKLEQYKRDMIFKIFNTREDLDKWLQLFIGFKLTKDWIDKDSNSSPIDAIWTVYQAVRDNTGDKIPGYIFLSSRETFKTVSASLLEVLIMVHFRGEVGHMAAIRSQSEVAMGYIQSFFRKLKPYLEYHGWELESENKTIIKYLTPDNNNPSLKIVVCTMAGANAFHCSYFFIDEIDLIPNPKAYDESRSIPGSKNGKYPITVKLSTRKFSFGLMNFEIENRHVSGDMLLRWNVMDAAERCPKSRHLPEKPFIKRVIGTRLPLVNMSLEDLNSIPEEKRSEYEVVDCFAGCKDCKLLPVCRTKLAYREESCTGGFYKSLSSIEMGFRNKPVEYAEAQLLCWRPSTKGLVYPRFCNIENVITCEKAYELLTGEKRERVSFDLIRETVISLGILVVAALDWGFRHKTAIVVGCKLPNGDFLILTTYSATELELDQIVRKALELKDLYGIQKWFCDTAAPSNIKTFKRNGLSCGEFKKDVIAGIESVRGVLCDALGRRRLKIIKTPDNEELVVALQNHHFKLDKKGEPTREPDDEEHADTCFPQGTLITTLEGLKPIERVSCSDYVLTHKGEYKKVLSTMSRYYRGDLVQIRSFGKTMLECTPNHPIYTMELKRSTEIENGKKLTGQRRLFGELSFKPAESLKIPTKERRKNDPVSVTYFPKPKRIGEWDFIDMRAFLPFWTEENGFLVSSNSQSKFITDKEIKTPRFLKITEELSFLIGYYVAEGSCGGNRSSVCFAGHLTETNVLPLIEEVSKQIFGGKVSLRPSKTDNGRTIILSHPGLHAFLKTLGKEESKHFPYNSIGLSDENLEAMLLGYLFGDGSFLKGQRGIASVFSNSISKDISFWVYSAMVRLGFRPNFNFSRRAGRWGSLGLSGVIEKNQWNTILNSEDTLLLIDKIKKNKLIELAYKDKRMNTKSAVQSSFCQQKTEEGVASSIQSLSKRYFEGRVFNIEVEEHNSYVANCITVHNCDALRYMGQNLFSPKGGGVGISKDFVPKPIEKEELNQRVIHNEQFKQEIKSLVEDTEVVDNTRKSKGGLFWSM